MAAIAGNLHGIFGIFAIRTTVLGVLIYYAITHRMGALLNLVRHDYSSLFNDSFFSAERLSNQRFKATLYSGQLNYQEGRGLLDLSKLRNDTHIVESQVAETRQTRKLPSG
jgi:hypothetical protein